MKSDELRYAEGQLAQAVVALAASAISIQDRLRVAYGHIHTLAEYGFPNPEQLTQYSEVIDSLTVVRNRRGYHLDDTLDRMGDREAERIAAIICKLSREMTMATGPR